MKLIAFTAPKYWFYGLLLSLSLSACNSCQAQKEKTATKVYTRKIPSPGGTGKVYFGREIAGIINPSGASWLERNNRQEEEKVLQAIDSMMLSPHSIVADIGAGTGYYTFRISPKGPKGKVYAVDVQDAFIAALNKKKQELKLANVEVVKGGSKSINLPDASLDLAFMVDVYHELEYPQEMLQSIFRALKPNGKLLLIEYRAEDPSIEIRRLHKLSVAQANKELKANGYKLYKRQDFMPIQHFLLYEKAKK